MKIKYMYVGVAVLSLVLLSVTLPSTISYGENPVKFDLIRSDIHNHTPASDPSGKEVKASAIQYPGNKDKMDRLKKETEIQGFVPDAEISKKGGKYTKKSLMTYQEFINSENPDGFRHDIDPDRMLWVFKSKFDKTQYIEGKPVEKANITTVFDAESGEFFSITVTSDDPNGLKQLTNKE